MRLKVLAAALLVVCAFPAATAYAPATGDAATLDDASLAQQNATATEETTATDAADSDSESDSDGDDSASDYTNLYVESDYDHPELKPGESTEFTVSVKNGEDSSVTLDPHVYVPPVGENLIEESWVSIDGDATVPADGEKKFTVSVSVPDDAEIGYYRGQIAFTNETVTYPGRPERPVHATGVNVRVWKQPTVEIVSSTYLRGQVEAGDSATKQIVVKNTGDEAVPLSPQLKSERHSVRSSSSKVDPSWLDIEAPSSVGAGETATVTVTVSPPESAESNTYRGNLDLGLKDPNRRDDSSYWQQVDLRFEVWNQPSQPFQTSFEVSESAENVTLTLSPRSGVYGSTSNADAASFDVSFVTPDGTTVDAERVRVSDSGFVDLSETNNPSAQKQGEYSFRSGGQQYVYRVDDPQAGSWTLEVMPENVIGFNYEIVRNETAE